MEVKATITTSGLHNTLREKQAKLQQLPTVLEQIGRDEVLKTQERIRSSKTGPDGKPWAPWSMATLKQRTRAGNAQRGLLYRTGALLNSIQFKVENTLLTIFTNETYAKFLQFGTPKMKARPFVGFGKDINKAIQRLKDFLK